MKSICPCLEIKIILLLFLILLLLVRHRMLGGGCRGRDRMVVGFTTTYAISAYHN
jgi:hypothetical protein